MWYASVIVILGLLLQVEEDAHVSIRINDYEGSPYYDAFDVYLQCKGERVHLFSAFDEDLDRSTKRFSNDAFLEKMKKIERSRATLRIVVLYDDFGRPEEHLHKLPTKHVRQIKRGESVAIRIDLPSPHVESLENNS